MNRVCVLSDFSNYDPAYSLCRVVQSQITMLACGGYKPRLLVRKGFQYDRHAADYEGAEIVELDPGEIGGNVVNLTDKTGEEIGRLSAQMLGALKDFDVVMSHDMIYQPNMFKYEIAGRRVAAVRPDLKWLHWVHSATKMGVHNKMGQFKKEVQGQFPNSRLVAMHTEEVMRKGALFGYELDEIVIIPNAIDFCESFDPAAKQMVARADLMKADVIAFYPCRLDRGKQPHIIIEIFAELCKMGFNARVVIADFHSIAGDKLTYRDEMKKQADDLDVPVFFTSDMEGRWDGAPYNYCIPHKAVLDLMEVADVIVHPSVSECDPLILPEAMWKRCGLVLNFDLPVFRQYDGKALLYKFSSAIDVNTGMPGSTTTTYANRQDYMKHVAAGIAYQMEHNPVLRLHAEARKTRSLEGVWPTLWAAIEGM